MRKKILVLLSIALVLSANSRAQVTIGGLVDPANGAILDLNKTVKGGLALSNVDLPDFHTIPNGFPGIASQADVTTAVKSGFRGALVYNTGVTSPPAGLYVWNGKNWTPVKENCTPLTPALLTLTGPPFAKAGNDVTFLVSSAESAFCSQGESYKWYKTGAGNENYTLISGETASSLTTSFSPAGTYKVKVEVTNRYTATPVEKTATVEITDGLPPAPLLDASYSVTGDFCYDVKGPKPSSQTQAFYDSRMDGFAGGLTKTYTFTHTNDFSNLTVLNPGGIVAGVSQPVTNSGSGNGSLSITLTFVSDVKTRVIANNEPVQVQLVVSFKNNAGDTKVAYKNIKVQDAECGCPAQVPTNVHPSGWLTFQCHNLGADYDIRSDADLMNINATNFREYHGDWYKFGASTASLENTLANDSYLNSTEWQAKDYQSWSDDDDSQIDAAGKHLWKAENNPCPAGWQLATAAEWVAVLRNNTQQRYVNGVVMTSTSDWLNNGINNILKLGDYLYLPAASRRDYLDGELYHFGRGYYWTRTVYGSGGTSIEFTHTQSIFAETYDPDRRTGYSVRCVEK